MSDLRVSRIPIIAAIVCAALALVALLLPHTGWLGTDTHHVHLPRGVVRLNAYNYMVPVDSRVQARQICKGGVYDAGTGGSYMFVTCDDGQTWGTR